MHLLGSPKIMTIRVNHLGGQTGIACRSKVPTGKTGLDEIEKARAILLRELKGKRGDKHVEFQYAMSNGT